MENTMMIDYRNDNGDVIRKAIDRSEFCVKNGYAWFISGGNRFQVELENVIQVYFTEML